MEISCNVKDEAEEVALSKNLRETYHIHGNDTTIVLKISYEKKVFKGSLKSVISKALLTSRDG